MIPSFTKVVAGLPQVDRNSLPTRIVRVIVRVVG
jgi:hypothetical protein